LISVNDLNVPNPVGSFWPFYRRTERDLLS